MGRPKQVETRVLSTRVKHSSADLVDEWRGERDVATFLRALLRAEAKARAKGTTLLLPEDR